MNRLIYSLSISISLAGIIVFTGAMSGCTTKQAVTPIPPPVTQPTPTENQTTSIPTPEPTPIVQPTPTPTENQSIPIPTPTIVLNPVEQYAKSLGLSDDFVSILKKLGADNEMSETDRAAVDTANEIFPMNVTYMAKETISPIWCLNLLNSLKHTTH